MMESVRCANVGPHYYHGYFAQVTIACDGTTRCGDKTHDAHTFVETQSLWCPGICSCGLLSRGLHGPGDHK